jgi:hypothetical protein
MLLASEAEVETSCYALQNGRLINRTVLALASKGLGLLPRNEKDDDIRSNINKDTSQSTATGNQLQHPELFESRFWTRLLIRSRQI